MGYWFTAEGMKEVGWVFGNYCSKCGWLLDVNEVESGNECIGCRLEEAVMKVKLDAFKAKG